MALFVVVVVAPEDAAAHLLPSPVAFLDVLVVVAWRLMVAHEEELLLLLLLLLLLSLPHDQE